MLILSPILYYTFHLPEIVLGFGKQSTGLRLSFTELLQQRWHSLDLMLRGVWMMEFTAGPVPEDLRRGFGLLLLFLASFFTLSRAGQFLSLTALGIWVWNLFFPDAGRMHHVLLLAPLWQAAAGVLSEWPGVGCACCSWVVWCGPEPIRYAASVGIQRAPKLPAAQTTGAI